MRIRDFKSEDMDRGILKRLRHGFEEAFGRDFFDEIHPTRKVEWPWALMKLHEYGSLAARVVDLGSDPYFGFGTISSFYAMRMTMLKTHADISTLSKHPIELPWLRNKERVRMVVGCPHLWPDLGPFDAVFNISVLEHVEPWLAQTWIDYPWRWLRPGGIYICTMDVPGGSGVVGHMYPHELALPEDCEIVEGEDSIPWLPGFEKRPTIVTEDDESGFEVVGFVLRKKNDV